MKKEHKELLKSLLMGYGIIFIISLPVGNLVNTILFSIVLCFFFYEPFLPLIHKIKNINFVERFILSFVLGFGYASIYVVMDVIFKIQLTKFTYFITTLCITTVSYVYYFFTE